MPTRKKRTQPKKKKLPPVSMEDPVDYTHEAPEPLNPDYRTVGYRVRRDDEWADALDKMAHEHNRPRAFMVRRMVEHAVRAWKTEKMVK